MKVLKRHAALAVTLAPQTQKRSFVLDDLVGMLIAGLAMGFALVTLWLAQRSSAQFGALYIMIYIMGYILKARPPPRPGPGSCQAMTTSCISSSPMSVCSEQVALCARSS